MNNRVLLYLYCLCKRREDAYLCALCRSCNDSEGLYRRQSSDSIMKCKGVRLVRIRMAIRITHSNHTPLKLSQFWPDPGGIILVVTVWGR